MKYIMLVFSVMLIIFTDSCTEDSPLISDSNLIVIQGYLYANEPVNDIRITTTVPLDVDTTASDPINDAEVYIIKNNQRYLLENSPGDSGYYHYGDNDLSINVGDQFYIEVNYYNNTATGHTIVPDKPTNINISSSTLTVPDFDNMGFGDFDRDSLFITLSWDNEDNSYYYVVVENIEENPQEIERGGFSMPRRFISRPTNRDNYAINMFAITHLGMHKAILYKVNQEYADLYESREQDSRDLNEPQTNIENGLGIFSAFNSDSLFFEVKQ